MSSTSHTHTNTDPSYEGVHHTLPFNTYLYVFATLIVLTILTVWVAQFHFGILNGFVAMFIATVKASLVGMYFMHLKYDNKLYASILVTAVAFLVLLWFFSIFDFVTRVVETNPL